MRRLNSLVIVLAAATPSALFGLPTMIRLGYPNCVSCHVSPQGGGLLSLYGKGIDLAQSRKGGEYQPADGPWDVLSLGGRIEQDLRAAMSSQLTTTTGGPVLSLNRSRFFYRNVTTLGKGFRIAATVNGESDTTMRKSKVYDPPLRPGLVLVSAAVLHYRPKEGLEFAAGRDALPQGLIIPDQTTYVKARNRLGYYDVPTQLKAFFWGKRWMAMPFAFGPSGRESATARESGGGLVAEYDLSGKGRLVAGFNGLSGSDLLGVRDLYGVYTRLGFGAWGILAEHDSTQRRLRRAIGSHSAGVPFGQQASYLQGFRYVREWLVTSVIVERLSVTDPYAEHLWSWKGEVSARLSNHFTVGLRAGVQRDFRSGALTPVAALSLAMKTVR